MGQIGGNILWFLSLAPPPPHLSIDVNVRREPAMSVPTKVWLQTLSFAGYPDRQKTSHQQYFEYPWVLVNVQGLKNPMKRAARRLRETQNMSVTALLKSSPNYTSLWRRIQTILENPTQGQVRICFACPFTCEGIRPQVMRKITREWLAMYPALFSLQNGREDDPFLGAREFASPNSSQRHAAMAEMNQVPTSPSISAEDFIRDALERLDSVRPGAQITFVPPAPLDLIAPPHVFTLTDIRERMKTRRQFMERLMKVQ